MVTAFIVGATGYTGRHLTERLPREGVRTVAHVRPDSPALGAWRARFTAAGATVDATPWDDDMARTMARLRPEFVFALLGTTRSRAARDERATGRAAGYEAVDYGLTALLLKAVRTAGVRPRFVYLSSLGASATSRNPYLEVRGRFEGELKASGLPYLIVQPSFISGSDRDERRFGERAASLATDGLLRLVAFAGGGALRDRWATLSGRALAAGMARLALGHPDGRAVADAADIRRAARGDDA
ncbi:MAG: NAD(P)H-binding protein [Gemmatimonadota bacterium]|nr:NAD(P)H-binding protein [Gemmatimonadota bacterium]